MSAEFDIIARVVHLFLDAGQNVPPDAYPGGIPAGYGGFLPGYPGSQLPRIPVPGQPNGDPYHDASENCRNLYNGLNATAQDQGHHRAGPRGDMHINKGPMVDHWVKAMESCKEQGWTPNTL